MEQLFQKLTKKQKSNHFFTNLSLKKSNISFTKRIDQISTEINNFSTNFRDYNSEVKTKLQTNFKKNRDKASSLKSYNRYKSIKGLQIPSHIKHRKKVSINSLHSIRNLHEKQNIATLIEKDILLTKKKTQKIQLMKINNTVKEVKSLKSLKNDSYISSQFAVLKNFNNKKDNMNDGNSSNFGLKTEEEQILEEHINFSKRIHTNMNLNSKRSLDNSSRYWNDSSHFLKAGSEPCQILASDLGVTPTNTPPERVIDSTMDVSLSSGRHHILKKLINISNSSRSRSKSKKSRVITEPNKPSGDIFLTHMYTDSNANFQSINSDVLSNVEENNELPPLGKHDSNIIQKSKIIHHSEIYDDNDESDSVKAAREKKKQMPKLPSLANIKKKVPVMFDITENTREIGLELDKRIHLFKSASTNAIHHVKQIDVKGPDDRKYFQNLLDWGPVSDRLIQFGDKKESMLSKALKRRNLLNKKKEEFSIYSKNIMKQLKTEQIVDSDVLTCFYRDKVDQQALAKEKAMSSIQSRNRIDPHYKIERILESTLIGKEQIKRHLLHNNIE